MRLIDKEISQIIELLTSKDEINNFPKLNSFAQILGNIVFVAACMVLPIKGCFFIYHHWYPSTEMQNITPNHTQNTIPEVYNNGIDPTPKSIMLSDFQQQQLKNMYSTGIIKSILKQPHVLIFLILASVFIVLLVTKVVVFIKIFAKPFHIMAIYGSVALAIRIIRIGFSNDYSSYHKFLLDFIKGIF